MASACARSTSITTDAGAAYRYSANIHNQGEGVICGAEASNLTGRRVGLSGPSAGAIAAANPVPVAPPRSPSLAAPTFDEAAYRSLPDFGPIFTYG